jgi:hypothetical protein
MPFKVNKGIDGVYQAMEQHRWRECGVWVTNRLLYSRGECNQNLKGIPGSFLDKFLHLLETLHPRSP